MLFSAYNDHYILFSNDELWVGGNNRNGQLGLGSMELGKINIPPTKLSDQFDGSGIRTIKCLDGSSIVLTIEGNVYISGKGNYHTHFSFYKMLLPLKVSIIERIGRWLNYKVYIALVDNELYLWNYDGVANCYPWKVTIDGVNSISKLGTGGKFITIVTDCGLWFLKYENVRNKNYIPERSNFDKYRSIIEICYFRVHIVLFVREEQQIAIYSSTTGYDFHLESILPGDIKIFINSGVFIVSKMEDNTFVISRVVIASVVVKITELFRIDKIIIDIVQCGEKIFIVTEYEVYLFNENKGLVIDDFLTEMNVRSKRIKRIKRVLKID